jgi:hypothetical protein
VPARAATRLWWPGQGFLAGRRADRAEHAGQVVADSVVREAQDAVAGVGEGGAALGVSRLLPSVDRAIELDAEAALDTAEVEDERPDRVLAAELQAVQPSTAQRLPEELLGGRLALAQISR